MQHVEQRFEVAQCSFVSLVVDGLAVSRLHHFEVPTRKFVPEEAINGHKGFRNAIFREQVV
jgi:hypothetical protein